MECIDDLSSPLPFLRFAASKHKCDLQKAGRFAFFKSYLLEVKHLFFEVGFKSFGIQATIVNGAGYADDTIRRREDL